LNISIIYTKGIGAQAMEPVRKMLANSV